MTILHCQLRSSFESREWITSTLRGVLIMTSNGDRQVSGRWTASLPCVLQYKSNKTATRLLFLNGLFLSCQWSTQKRMFSNLGCPQRAKILRPKNVQDLKKARWGCTNYSKICFNICKQPPMIHDLLLINDSPGVKWPFYNILGGHFTYTLH